MKTLNRNTATFAAHLYAGAASVVGTDPFEPWGGHVGFTASILPDHARAIAKRFATIIEYLDPPAVPGVLEYEVIEPLGRELVCDAAILPEEAADLFELRYRAWLGEPV